jgi:hypothetical protein
LWFLAATASAPNALPSGHEVTCDTEYGDAGQDQQRRRADDAAQQTIAREVTVREMTVHGLKPSDASLSLSLAGGEGSLAPGPNRDGSTSFKPVGQIKRT